MRGLLTAFGIALFLAGGLFALQGAGVVIWPAESFMLRQQSWVGYGIAIALAGIALIALARGRRR